MRGKRIKQLNQKDFEALRLAAIRSLENKDRIDDDALPEGVALEGDGVLGLFVSSMPRRFKKTKKKGNE